MGFIDIVCVKFSDGKIMFAGMYYNEYEFLSSLYDNIRDYNEYVNNSISDRFHSKRKGKINFEVAEMYSDRLGYRKIKACRNTNTIKQEFSKVIKKDGMLIVQHPEPRFIEYLEGIPEWYVKIEKKIDSVINEEFYTDQRYWEIKRNEFQKEQEINMKQIKISSINKEEKEKKKIKDKKDYEKYLKHKEYIDRNIKIEDDYDVSSEAYAELRFLCEWFR